MESVSENLLRRRIADVRGKLAQHEADALLITRKENKYFLSMFHSTSYDLVITEQKNYILTDFRYIEAAGDLDPLFEVVEITKTHRREDFLRTLEIPVLGIEYETVTVAGFHALQKALEHTTLVAADDLIPSIRAVKDDYEKERIARAEAIGDEAFSEILPWIRPGVTEKEIAFRLEWLMRERGAEALSFDTICVSGVRTSLPHGEPTDKKIETGDFVTMDFGCVFEGYCSDMTRTVAVGNVTEEQKKVYEIVLRTQKETCEAVRAGMSGKEVDAFARTMIEKEGYGDCFGHGLGHGVGLEIHESPTAGPTSSDILKPGMLLTIEPGIYLPGRFGVRIEDLSIVTDSDIINLTMSEKELIIL